MGVSQITSPRSEGGDASIQNVSGADLMVFLYPVDGTHDSPFSFREFYQLYVQEIADPFTGFDAADNHGPLNISATPLYSRPAPFTHKDPHTDEDQLNIYFVGVDGHIYLIHADGSEERLTTSGNYYSIAVSPDGKLIALTTNNASDRNIYLLDTATGNLRIHEIVDQFYSRDAQVSSIIRYADSLAFNYTGRKLIFDYLSCIPIRSAFCTDETAYQYWSIGILNVTTGTFDFPFPDQSPQLDLGFPRFATNTDRHIAYDLHDSSHFEEDDKIDSLILTYDLDLHHAEVVATANIGTLRASAWGVPSFSGDDDYLLYQTMNDSHAFANRIKLDNFLPVPNSSEILNGFDVAMPIAHRNAARTITGVLSVDQSSIDFGIVPGGLTVSHNLTLSNPGERDVLVNDIVMENGLFTHNVTNRVISPNESVIVNLTLDSTDLSGVITDRLTLKNDGDSGLSIDLTAFVELDFDHDGILDHLDDDDDGDGVLDIDDELPFDATESVDSDGDGIGNNADTDDDNDGVADTDDAFPLDHTESADNDLDGVGDNADIDDDNDGVADSIDAFPFDEYETTDTDADGVGNNSDSDDDGDGLTNLQEFLSNKQPRRDDVAPVIGLDDPKVVDATGQMTAISFADVSAQDHKDGTVAVSSDQSGPFKPGRYIIRWQAVDQAGNVAVREQVLDVRPLVSVQPDQLTVEGREVTVQVLLNGEAPSYPVIIDYEISGTADSIDHTAADSQLTILQGLTGAITFNILEDDIVEAEENIVITLTNTDQAAIGVRNSHTVTITESNLAPSLRIVVSQNQETRRIITADGGTVEISALAEDPNPKDQLNFDWSGTDSALQLDSPDDPVVNFEPLGIAPGNYVIKVEVTDDGNPPQMTGRELILCLVDQPPDLSTSEDSDSDGISDQNEGFGDSDGDGIADYLDYLDDLSLLPVADGDSDNLMQTDAGLRLKLGSTAFSSEKQSASITAADIQDHGDDEGGSVDNYEDRRFEYPNGLFDFSIDQLPIAGQSVQVVIPLSQPIPADAVYRKFAAITGWQDFVEDSRNRVQSAAGELGACPQPGSPLYLDDLKSGAFCIQLTIEDGGPNDTDDVSDGVVRDPGGVAVPVIDRTPPVLTAPAAVSIEAEDQHGVALRNDQVQQFLSNAECIDDLDGELEASHNAQSNLGLGENRISFTCTDISGNVATDSSTIQVVDTSLPIITTPATLSIQSATSLSSTDSRIADFISSVTCTDSVSGDLSVSNDSPANFAIGTTTVLFNCTDQAGNTAQRAAGISISQPVQGSGGGGGSCFIATAAFGSYLDPQVKVLRDFRDTQLLTNSMGTVFVEVYYRYSPALAELIAQSETLRSVTRWALTPLIYGVLYPARALAILLLLLGICMTAS